MIREFITTVYHLAANGRWDDLKEYFALIREILSLPTMTITVGKPTDKDK